MTPFRIPYATSATEIATVDFMQYKVTGSEASVGIGGAPNLLPSLGDTNVHLFDVVNDNRTEQMFAMTSIGASVFQNNMHFFRSRGTAAAPTAIQSGDYILSMGFRGQYGTGTGNMSQSQAAFQVITTQNWGSAQMGCAFDWQTTQNGTISRIQRMRLTDAGTLLIGPSHTSVSSADGQLLDIRKDQNALTIFKVKNGTSGTGAGSGFLLTNQANEDLAAYMFSAGYTPLGIIQPSTAAVYSNSTGGLNLGALNSSGSIQLMTGANNTSNIGFVVSSAGNLVLGRQAALATNATNGFAYMPSGAGTPTGTPTTSYTGKVAFYYDTTNSKIYIYSGGVWKATAALT